MKNIKNIIFIDRLTVNGGLFVIPKPYLGEGKKESYLDLIKLCIEHTPQGGFGPKDFKDRVTLLNAIDKSVEKFNNSDKSKLKTEEEKQGEFVIEFEDAVAETLKKCVNNMRWHFFNREIHKFIEYTNEQLR